MRKRLRFSVFGGTLEKGGTPYPMKYVVFSLIVVLSFPTMALAAKPGSNVAEGSSVTGEEYDLGLDAATGGGGSAEDSSTGSSTVTPSEEQASTSTTSTTAGTTAAEEGTGIAITAEEAAREAGEEPAMEAEGAPEQEDEAGEDEESETEEDDMTADIVVLVIVALAALAAGFALGRKK